MNYRLLLVIVHTVDFLEHLVELRLCRLGYEEGADGVDGPVARRHVHHARLRTGEPDMPTGILLHGDKVSRPGLQLVTIAKTSCVPCARDHMTRQHLFE